ncbi:MAG: pyruvate ferredoxin oxidoreductase subunit gamma [Bacillota bacterium]
MKEIRIHGRGGQGSVVLAEMFAVAAFAGGKYSQAFPYLGGGGERRGAPVQAFARISDDPIRLRSRIKDPDYVIVQDVSLLGIVDVFKGLKSTGIVLINSEKEAKELGERVITVPATHIALEKLGVPITNTAIMGAFAAATGELTLDAVEKVIRSRFPGVLGERNAEAAAAAYSLMKRCGE